MPDIINQIRSRAGHYKGHGTDCENRIIVGELTIDPMQAGRGVAVTLIAARADGDIVHEERSLISGGGDSYFMLSNTFPGILQLDLRSVETLKDGRSRCLFGRGDVQKKSTLPIELVIGLWTNGDVGFSYSWGLAGQPYGEQLSMRMRKVE